MLEREWVSLGEKRARRLKRVCRGLALGAIGAALVLSDRALYHLFEYPQTEPTWWHQTLKQVGYLPVWVGVALTLLIVDALTRGRSSQLQVAPSWPPRPIHHRAGLVLLAAACSGLAAEVMKLFARRLRPNALDGLYVFRPFWDQPLSSSGVGFPSSHTAVAFGGAVMLGLLLPRIRWFMLILALGCGVSRMLAGAHFASDVYIGALLGAWIALAFYRAGQGPRRGPAGGLVWRR